MTAAIRAALALSTVLAATAPRYAIGNTIAIGPAPTLASITTPSTTITGGFPVNFVVQITEASPLSPYRVALTSSNPAVLVVPTAVVILAGRINVGFVATTNAVSALELATITATGMDGTRKAISIRVIPPAVSTVAFAPGSVAGGQPVMATITLTAPAPSTGIVVGLSSSSTALTMPGKVTVPAGAKSIQVNGTTNTVPATVTATVSATPAATTATGSVTITASPPRIVSITAQPNVVSNSNASVLVTFDRAVDTTYTIRIVPSDTMVVPRFIIGAIAAGQTSRLVQFTPKPVNAHRTVTLATMLNGDSVRVTTTVIPMTVELSLAPDSVVGTGSSTATIRLNATPATSMALNVTSNQSSAVVPSSVTMSQIQTTFGISTFAVTSAVQATITARIPSTLGNATATRVFTVIPATITRFLSAPDSVPGHDAEPSYRTLSAHITYALPAPANGTTLALSSTAQMQNMPTSILIPAGQSTATFTAVVATSNAAGNYSLRATTQNGHSATAPFRVWRPPPLPEVSSLVISESQVLGGATVNGTITLDKPAVSNYNVQLWAPTLPGGIASVTFQPALVPIPVGQTTATFTATAIPVAAATPRVISASKSLGGQISGVLRSDTLTVLPGSVSAFTLPQPTLFAGQQMTGTVALTTPRGMVPVTATSSDTSVATVAVISSPNGATSVSIPITARAVAAPASATITVTYAGSSQTATVTVNPASRLASVALPAGPILPLNFPVTVSLTGPAPAGGATVSLLSMAVQGFTNGTSSSQSTVTIPAGQSSSTVQIPSLLPRDLTLLQVVNASYTPTGNAQQPGDFRGDTVEVRVLTLDGGTGPGAGVFSTMKSGDTLTVTVRTNIPAPSNGLTLNGSSAQPTVATITPSATIPFNQSTASFRIIAQPVTTSTQLQARIDAVGLSGSLFLSLTVNPPE